MRVRSLAGHSRVVAALTRQVARLTQHVAALNASLAAGTSNVTDPHCIPSAVYGDVAAESACPTYPNWQVAAPTPSLADRTRTVATRTTILT